MSSGLVSILFCLSIMESRGEVSVFLKTFWFMFVGLFSYICRYFDTAFIMQSLVYFVVILQHLYLYGRITKHYEISIQLLGGVYISNTLHGQSIRHGDWFMLVSKKINIKCTYNLTDHVMIDVEA